MTICLAILLTACVPAGPDTTPSGFTTPIAGTASARTVSPATVLPVLITPLPPDTTLPPGSLLPTPTFIPTLRGGMGPSELKYQVLAQFPDLFFCDSDFFPIARADETDLARQRFPELQANPEEFNTILSHNQLAGLTTFSDEQKLLVYREHKKLAAVHFELADNHYQFQILVAPNKGQGESISGSIDGQGKITVQQRKPAMATCPI